MALEQLCDIQMVDGGSEIYREVNQRYVAIKYSVRGRDLGSAVDEAIGKVGEQVKVAAWLPHQMGGRGTKRSKVAARASGDDRSL